MSKRGGGSRRAATRGSATLMSLLVMGIDPGSRFTGYGIVADKKGTQLCITHGRVIVKGQSTAERLFHIYTELHQLIKT